MGFEPLLGVADETIRIYLKVEDEASIVAHATATRGRPASADGAGQSESAGLSRGSHLSEKDDPPAGRTASNGLGTVTFSALSAAATVPAGTVVTHELDELD